MLRQLMGVCVLLAVSAQVSAHSNRERDEGKHFNPSATNTLDVLGYYTRIGSRNDSDKVAKVPHNIAMDGTRAIVVSTGLGECNSSSSLCEVARTYLNYGNDWHESQTLSVRQDWLSATTGFDYSNYIKVSIQCRWALLYSSQSATIFVFNERNQQWQQRGVVRLANNAHITEAVIDRRGQVVILDDSAAGRLHLFHPNHNKTSWADTRQVVLGGADADYRFTGPLAIDGNNLVVRGESKTQSVDVYASGTGIQKQMTAALWAFAFDGARNQWRMRQRIDFPASRGDKTIVWGFDVEGNRLALAGYDDADRNSEYGDGDIYGAYVFKRDDSRGVWRADSVVFRARRTDFGTSATSLIASDVLANHAFNGNDSGENFLWVDLLADRVVLRNQYMQVAKQVGQKSWRNMGYLFGDFQWVKDAPYITENTDKTASSAGQLMFAGRLDAVDVYKEMNLQPVNNLLTIVGHPEPILYPDSDIERECPAPATPYSYDMYSVFNPGPGDLYGVRWFPKLGAGNKLIAGSFWQNISPNGDRSRNDIGNQYLFNFIPAKYEYYSAYWQTMPKFNVCVAPGAKPDVGVEFWGLPR